MQKLIHFFYILVMILLIVGCGGDGLTGTVSEVGAGSISGQIVKDGVIVTDSVMAYLYKETSRSKEKIVLDSQLVINGTYKFEDLPEGLYLIDIIKDSLSIGAQDNVLLGKDEHKVINVNVTIIINQTFYINIINQNVTINNFIINNGKVESDSSGILKLKFTDVDTQDVQITIVENGTTKVVKGQLIKLPDGTFTIILVDDSSITVETEFLLGSYLFSNNINDDTPSGNHGINVGATFGNDRFGFPSKAPVFDGVNDHIKIPNLNLTKDFSISLWVKPEAKVDMGTLFYQGDSANTTSDFLQVATNYTSGVMASTINPENSDTLYGVSDKTISQDIGLWQHYCLIAERGKSVRLYKNKTLVDSAALSDQPIKSKSVKTLIGVTTDWSTGAYSHYFKGQIDDILIYNYDITKVQIDSLYHLDGWNGNPVKTIAVTSPAAGAIWEQGSTQEITWTDNIAGNVKIELFEGALLKTVISESTESDGSFSWQMSSDYQPSTGYSIKITSVDDATIIGESPLFEIQSKTSITIDQQYFVDRTFYWDDVTIGSTLGTITFDLNGIAYPSWSQTTNTWKLDSLKHLIISTNGKQYVTRFIWNESKKVFDGKRDATSESQDGVISILREKTIEEKTITVTSPTAGLVWEQGSTQEITWTDNIAGNVKIELWEGTALKAIISESTESDGSFSWQMSSAYQPSASYSVKITSIDDATVAGASPLFEIKAKTISSPFTFNSNNSVLGDVTFNFSDTTIAVNSGAFPIKNELLSHDAESLLVRFERASGEAQIYTGYAAADTSWIGGISTYGEKIRPWLMYDNDVSFQLNDEIKTIDAEGTWVLYVNNSISGTLTIEDNTLSFTGNEAIQFGNLATDIKSQSASISFTRTSGENQVYQGYFSADGQFIVGNFSFGGKKGPWFATKVENFKDTIAVTSPTAGEVWEHGSTQEITWTDNVAGNVKIELWKDAQLATVIAASTESDGSFSWQLGSALQASANYSVKITSIYDATVVGESPLFEIKAKEVVTGLIASYPFNGNTNDESGNNFHGTNYGTTFTTDRHGNANAAGLFNGTSSYAEIPDVLNNLTTGTVTGWVKGSRTIIDKTTGYVKNYFNTYMDTSGTIGFGIDITYGVNDGILYYDFEKKVNTNQWNHFAIVWNSTGTKYYVNNRLQLDTTAIIHLDDIDAKTFFGKNAHNKEFFKGEMDDINIYNTALESSVIDSLFHVGGWTGNKSSFTDNFSTDLSAWTIKGDKWIINKDDNTLQGDYAITMGSTSHPQADIVLKSTYQISDNYIASVDFTRIQDPNVSDYYQSMASFVLWINPENKLKISVGNGGYSNWGGQQDSITASVQSWQKVWSSNVVSKKVPHQWTPEQWNTARIKKAGNKYTIYIDETELMTYTDTIFNGQGEIGLHTYGRKKLDNFIIAKDE